MPNWKKVVVSGSAPTLSGLTVRGPLEVSMTASSGNIPLSIKAASDLSTDTIIQVRDDGGSFDLMTFDSEGRFNMRGTSTDTEGAGYYVSQGGVTGEHARMGFVSGKAQLSIAANGAADKFRVFVNGSQTSPMVGLTGRGTLALGTDTSAATLPNEARTNTMFIKTGTAPSTAEADNIQFFAQDVNSVAGTASPTFLTEDGTTIQLGVTSSLDHVEATTFKGDGSQLTGISVSTPTLQQVTDQGASTTNNISLPNSGQSIDFTSNAGIYGRTGGSYPGLHIASGTGTSARIWLGNQFNTTGAITASFLGLGQISNVHTIEPHGNYPLILRGGKGPNDANDGIQMFTGDASNVYQKRFEIEAYGTNVDAYFTNINGFGINKTSNFLAELDVSGDINASGDITASKFLGDNFVKSGGTSTEFLKADGSVDSSTYLTSAFPFTGDAQITGSLNISGSTTIEIPTGDAFTILEGDKDQQSRLTFDYTNGDPTLTIASRASTAKVVIRADLSSTKLTLDENGEIYVGDSNSDGVKINGTCFASIGTNANALDLGSTSRPWNDVYLRSTGGIIIDGGTSAQFLKADGSVDSTAYTTNTGTVTGVTGTAPIVSSGGTTPAISISAATNSAAGSMSAIDKGKIDAITVTSGVNLNTMNSSISTNTSNISGKAASGANSDITSLSGLTTALSPSQGGTGATALDDIALSSFDDDLSYVDLVNAQTISGTKTFSVAQRFATGTVSAPSISFNSNNTYTTGFYLSNPHELSISRVGVQNFKFDSNGFQQLIAGGISNFAGHLQAHCLGIGGTPSTTSGEIWAYGDVVANKSSDRRLKKYIKNIKNPLDKLSKINGVTFEWKKADEKMKKEVHSHEGPDVGVIAQEVEEVLPEIVATRDNGYKAVYYEKLVPLLIEAVKELKAEVDELKKSK